jgi:hypothetical protein
MAQANAAVLGVSPHTTFVHADLTAPLPLRAYSALSCSLALFFDPARRSSQRRAFSVHGYSPPLGLIRDWLSRFPALGVKISPGVALAELSGYDCEIEFISLRGELKEAALWFGPLRSVPLRSRALKTVLRRATLLPGLHTLTSEQAISKAPLAVSPQAYLYEPDPAILRAGLVAALAEMLNASQLDPDIAYLTSDKQTPTPLARVWAVEDWFPFHLKRLRAYLRERGVGRVVVKKRGSPITPEAFIRALRLTGELERTIFLTHLRGQPIVVIALEGV